MPDTIKIFSGRANLSLAKAISNYIKIPLGRAKVALFSDGECNIQIQENVRGVDCFIIQPTSSPVNENLMELLTMVDALFRASARRITTVIPYYGYARQDRKVIPRVPITAKLVANLLTAAGVNRVVVIDLHAGQIQGFFDIPVDNLYAFPIFLKYLKDKKFINPVIVSPDPGGVERANAYAVRMGVSLAIADKRRPEPNKSEVINIVGEVKDKTAIIIDDLIDTGGTLINVAQALIQRQAKEVYAIASHGVFSDNAVENINNSVIKKVIISDSIDNSEKIKNFSKFEVLSIAELLGEAILRIHNETSVSSLFI